MRIISGQFKGRNIIPPKNLKARPTTDFAKENLFNILNGMIDYEECDVLDLFSGTGSISYEFASRGAASITSVEINRVHWSFISKTMKDLQVENSFVVNANVFLYLKSCTKQFDVIFSDAPYDLKVSLDVIDLVKEKQLLKPGGILIFEHSDQVKLEDREGFQQHRSYGSVNFSFFSFD